MRGRLLAAAILVAAAIPAVALAISAAMSPVVSAKLVGKTEVPKGSPTGSGTVVLHLDAKTGRVCWTFNVGKIDKPTAAHIHKGKVGVAGPVVVPLGFVYKAKSCINGPSNSKVFADIEKHPSSYYVNVHTAKYPAGAIRGQLVAGTLKG